MFEVRGGFCKLGHKFLAGLKVKCKRKVRFLQLQFDDTRFFFTQHFYKQHQAEIGKKLSKS